ncbi:MAG TPA: hypothetical protein VGM17_06545 [Rhizomicrobium sp.]|jgi:hypothetical protein
MGKIGVGIGEEFPVGVSNDARKPFADAGQADSAEASAQGGPSEHDARVEFERWKWQREGQHAWDEDVRNQRAEWEASHRAEWDAWKRALKDKIRAAVVDGLGRNDNGRRNSWGYSWRPRFWPLGACGIGIAALILAIPVLVVIAIVALIAAAISAPLTILGILAALILISIAARHHRHGHTAGRYRYYTDADIQSPPRTSSPRRRGPIVTPPPQEHS